VLELIQIQKSKLMLILVEPNNSTFNHIIHKILYQLINKLLRYHDSSIINNIGHQYQDKG
jgi:hypothetical protein